MTPLMQRILRSPAFTLEEKAHLAPARAFECSEVAELADEMADVIYDAAVVDGTKAFMPAQRVWLEWAPTRSVVRRIGVLLDWIPNKSTVWALVFTETLGREVGLVRYSVKFACTVGGATALEAWRVYSDGSETVPGKDDEADSLASTVLALLSIINSPRVFARDERAPHKGLVREIARSGVPGELRPWTEIRLRLEPSVERPDLAGQVVTGKKAWHQVRAHGRIRQGRWEWVRSHARGDLRLGVVRSTYKVEQ